MPAIGITGGISTGKSTFAECLRKLQPIATFFDADEAAHALDLQPHELLDAPHLGRIGAIGEEIGRAHV